MKNILTIVLCICLVLYSIALNITRNNFSNYKETSNHQVDSLNNVICLLQMDVERLSDIECESKKLNHLWHIISKIESSGGLNLVGDNDKAFGELQIHKGVVIDVNKRYGTNYTHMDMFDVEKAKEVGSMYLNINAERYYSRYGKYPTLSSLVRSWNGGYGGFTNKLTLKYENKFINYLNDV